MRSTLLAAFGALLTLWSAVAAQDMDAVDALNRQAFQQNRAQREMVQRQIYDLRDIKAQVDAIMTQIELKSAPTYQEQADKYRQIEVLIPVAIRFSQELERKQKQLDQLDQEREAIRARVLDRQTPLPLWWQE